jgi:hypothetical protein
MTDRPETLEDERSDATLAEMIKHQREMTEQAELFSRDEGHEFRWMEHRRIARAILANLEAQRDDGK